MLRAAAIDFRRVGSKKLWAGTVLIHPNAKTGHTTTAGSKVSST